MWQGIRSECVTSLPCTHAVCNCKLVWFGFFGDVIVINGAWLSGQWSQITVETFSVAETGYSSLHEEHWLDRPIDVTVGGPRFYRDSSIFFRQLLCKLAKRNSTKTDYMLGSAQRRSLECIHCVALERRTDRTIDFFRYLCRSLPRRQRSKIFILAAASESITVFPLIEAPGLY